VLAYRATLPAPVRLVKTQPTLGHRDRKHAPPYCLRKLLLTAPEQLTQQGQGWLPAVATTEDPTDEAPQPGRVRNGCGLSTP
jgi:hypothetical protein